MVKLLLKMQVTEVKIKMLLSLCLYCTSQHKKIIFLLSFYFILLPSVVMDMTSTMPTLFCLLHVYMKCKIIYNQNSNIILISIGIYCSEYIKHLTIIIIETFKLKYFNRDYWNVIFITSVYSHELMQNIKIFVPSLKGDPLVLWYHFLNLYLLYLLKTNRYLITVSIGFTKCYSKSF